MRAGYGASAFRVTRFLWRRREVHHVDKVIVFLLVVAFILVAEIVAIVLTR